MFDEPTIYLTFEFIISIISMPINLFALYCIVKKTPIEMKEYKIPLIYTQLCTLVLDFVLLLIKPELMFPAIGGRIFGIWDSLFGFGAKQAMAVGAFLVVSTLSAIDSTFFVKLQSLLEPSSPYKLSKLGQMLFMSQFFVFYPLFISGCVEFFPIDQGTNTINFQQLIQSHPSFGYLSNITDFYTARFDPLYPPYIQFSALHLFCAGVLIYAVLATSFAWLSIVGCHYVITHRCPNMSMKTRKLQKKLFVALCIQDIIPLTSLGVPWICYSIIVFIQADVIYQAVNNFLFGFMGAHGVLASISLLILTEPYRRFVISIIVKTPIFKLIRNHFFKQTPSNIISVSNINSN